MTERHAGRPVSLLLEDLVLESIGHLPASRSERLKGMEPQLRAVFRAQGGWADIVRTRLSLPQDFEARVRASWTERVPTESDPAAFAHSFAEGTLR